MNRYIQTSNDGSSTIFSETYSEAYHSVHGAITESRHVFIQNGLMPNLKNNIRILEFGFGTGLNAILALETAITNHLHINYDTIELYPVEYELIEQLNYTSYFDEPFKKLFLELHSCSWNTPIEICNKFIINKIQNNFLTYKLSGPYDVIFYDAFSPEKQPELWTQDIFTKIFNSMAVESILTTYCAKGIVKRMLREIGFSVEMLPGPPGKRQMIRARK